MGWDIPEMGTRKVIDLDLFDGFVMKLDPTGTVLLYSSYLGGSGDEFVKGGAADSSQTGFLG